MVASCWNILLAEQFINPGGNLQTERHAVLHWYGGKYCLSLLFSSILNYSSYHCHWCIIWNPFRLVLLFLLSLDAYTTAYNESLGMKYGPVYIMVHKLSIPNMPVTWPRATSGLNKLCSLNTQAVISVLIPARPVSLSIRKPLTAQSGEMSRFWPVGDGQLRSEQVVLSLVYCE